MSRRRKEVSGSGFNPVELTIEEVWDSVACSPTASPKVFELAMRNQVHYTENSFNCPSPKLIHTTPSWHSNFKPNSIGIAVLVSIIEYSQVDVNVSMLMLKVGYRR